MNNFEFISFKATPGDQYMLGIVTIRAYGKIILRYKMVKTKDGSGTFFAPANYVINEGGEKKYVSCFMFDSRADEEYVLEFIRKNVKGEVVEEHLPF